MFNLFDKSGLSYLWSRLKVFLSKKADRIPITWSRSDSVCQVVPLVLLTGSDGAYCDGKLVLKRDNGVIILGYGITSIQISAEKCYNSSDVRFGILNYANHPYVYPVTFLYNEKKYFGIGFMGDGRYANFTQAHFEGKISDPSIVSAISYLNAETGSVLNAEINDSITVVTPNLPSRLYGTLNGTATTATKLETPRTINVGTAATGTAQSFDGTEDVTVPITAVKEAYLEWGGKNFAGSFGCLDAAMVPELGANRFAFGKAAGITVEYSRDSGSTWTDYGADDPARANLFSNSMNFYIGKASSTEKATPAYMLRVTIDTDVFGVYSGLNKFAIYVNTGGSNGCYCTIDASTEAAPDTWVTFANKINIKGWSGWNIINTAVIETYGNSSSKAKQYGMIRFTFGCTSHDSNYTGLSVNKIMAFGGMGWTTPSYMAKNGHLYSYDYAQNAVFPAKVKAANGGFIGDLDGNAGSATALTTSAGSVTQPVYFSNGKPVATTYTLGKSVPSDAVFTDTAKSSAALKDSQTVTASSAVSTITLSGTFVPSSNGIASRFTIKGTTSGTSAGAKLTIKSGSLSYAVSGNPFSEVGYITISASFDGIGWRFFVYKGTNITVQSCTDSFYWTDEGADNLVENITLDLSSGPAAYRVFPDSTWKLFGI